MSDIDNLIREALAKEEAELLDRVASEKSPFARALELFQGRNLWFNTMVAVITLVFFVVQIWCGVQFFLTEDIADKIGWAAGFLFGAICVSMLKLWSWMEMNNNAVIREVKRLELQVAYLNKRIGQEAGKPNAHKS